MTDEYYLAMAALDQYPIDDGLPKSTSVVYRIHQLGHAWEKSRTEPAAVSPLALEELVAEIDRLVAKYRFDAQDVGWLPLSQFAPVFEKLAEFARLRGKSL